jgi:polyisoprenoid-binding protein YceI
MKKVIFLIAVVLMANIGFSQSKNNINKSKISFKIKNLGINTGGTIGGLQANIQFNPADLATNSVEASVETKTINTDNDSRDEHLRSDDFFGVVRYPKITIKSISFKHNGGKNYTGTFNLTIKDKTKQIDIPFTYIDEGTIVAIKGNFKIDRLDFGVGGNSMILSNEVTVNVEAEIGK